jgi:hypothetical protein
LIGIKWRQLIHYVTDNRLLSPCFFREGARVKNRVTPLIDTNKLAHPLDEHQVYQHY